MSFGQPPAAGGGGRRGGSGGGGSKPATGAGGRSDMQDRLRELQKRQDAWMQQRERSLGASSASSGPAVEDEAEPRKPPRPQQPQQTRARPSAATAAATSAPSSTAVGGAAHGGLLDRVRLELDDIEREVRASAGLPPTAPQRTPLPSLAKTSAAGGSSGGLRPVSHYCPACGRLMLGGGLDPQLLSPCGHSVCAECAPRPAEAPPPLRCPHCGLRVSAARPDAALRSAVAAFVVVGGAAAAIPLAAVSAASTAAANNRWLHQLEVISGRMRQLDAGMEGLQAEVAQLTGQLEAEAARDRQLAGAEAAARKEIERLQTELRSLGELRAVSRDNQAFIQSEIDAKKAAIQGAFASQQVVSQELAKLQRLCSD